MVLAIHLKILEATPKATPMVSQTPDTKVRATGCACPGSLR
ncbi:Protein of unknown function [Pyronema omphalodes CBS 100304]|uniref:Uncharacterized protein n=1 Tax=Pyronema omphalodes (strain CBS 100304) TaxID=1076935 RepID=U4L187_PYROM|nr:Protein of unknown function [Pyronema omphalodes CBS 100304]